MTEVVERRIMELREGLSVPVADSLISAVRSKGTDLRTRHRRMVRTRIALASAVAIGLVGLSLTPPGRAATGWIADLAGVGEPPSLEQIGSVKGSATVLASGRLSDGTPYEVIAKKVSAESFARGATGSEEGAQTLLDRPGFRDIPDSLCFQVDWPGSRRQGQGGACTTSHATGKGNEPILETSGLFLGHPAGGLRYSGASGATGADRSRPAIFMGIADNQEVAKVRVVQVDRAGNERELQSELLVVRGESLERVGGRYPVAAFFTALNEEVVTAGSHREAQVSAIAYDSQGDELDRTDAFPPLDCPRNPRTLLPSEFDPQHGARPVTREEMGALRRAAECGARSFRTGN